MIKPQIMLHYRKVKSDINLHTYAITAGWWFVYVNMRQTTPICGGPTGSYCWPWHAGVSNMDSESNKGKRCLVYKENKCMEYYRKKQRKCLLAVYNQILEARVETENGTVVKDFGLHNHVDKVSNLSTVALRVVCKQKASEDVSHSSAKIIRSTVQSGIVPSADQVTSQDVVNCRAAMYRERRRKYGTLPKSLVETVQTLRVMPLSTHKKEDFLMFCEETNTSKLLLTFPLDRFHSHIDNQELICIRNLYNLRTLAACDIVLMDGTFNSRPRFFMQLYTISGYANHFYLPLVCGLLSNKEQSTYERFLLHVIA